MKISKLLIYIIVFLLPISLFSQQKTDSIISSIKQMPNDTNKINKLNKFAWQAVNQADYKTVINLTKESLALSEKMQFNKGFAYAYKSLGAVYYYKSQYDSAKYFYEKSLLSFEQIKSKKGIAIAYRNLGNVAHQETNYKQALEYYFKSLKLREEINDKRGIAAVKGSIGLVYLERKENIKALVFFKESLLIEKEIGNKYGIAQKSLYIGNVFFEKYKKSRKKNDADTALSYFYKCREISNNIEDPYFMAMSEESLGTQYYKLKNYKKAIIHLKKSLELNKKINHKFGIASSHYALAAYYSETRSLKEAEIEYLKAIKVSKQNKILSIENECCIDLSLIYAKNKDYASAYKYLLRHTVLKDTIYTQTSTKRMTQLAMQYEFDKKQKIEKIERDKQKAIEKAILDAEKKRIYIVLIFLFIGIISTLIFAFFMYKSYKNKKRANMLLADKNNEISSKNAILNQQNEEIEAQRDEIEEQRDYAITQHSEILKQKKHITDSIVYAQRIQHAVMPPKEYFDKILLDYFILFKPRDIVSGDYYWAAQKDNKTILVAADCTGHGVPGAFMSLLGIAFLNQIVNKINIEKNEKVIASKILDELRLAVKKSLRQTGKMNETKDGMDMALCVIDKENMTMQYSGAHNPLLLIRDNKIIQYKADRMPVGIYHKIEKPFTNTEIKLQKNDVCYIFSDGYIDQFGGERNRKFMIKRFKELILTIHDKSMDEQKQILDSTFNDWMNHPSLKNAKNDQIDDVLVMVFKI